VTLSARDKKLLLVIVPVVILFCYWFLLFAPKRHEAGRLAGEVSKQEQKRDRLNAEVQRLKTARKSFATDYATVVRLGKAIPNTVDMPSLIVQLQKAASGTGINFDRIHAGPRVSASQASSSSSSSGPAASTASAKSGGSASGSGAGTTSGSTGTPPPSAAGGKKAGTGFGRAAEQGNETKQSQDKQAQDTSKGGAPSSASGPGTSSGSPSAQSGATGQSTPSAPGLDTVPLEFTFRGDFFDLSDFFHRLKRFVHVANDRIAVSGRLMTVDGVDLKAVAFPHLEATVTATVYLSPKDEGATAGATPNGPAPGAAGQSSASTSSPAPSQPPAAVATP
jgi:hypothetical protein